MKHVHTFENFINEDEAYDGNLSESLKIDEKEVLLFDEVGPELEAFRSKIEKLINKSTDDKWIIALKKTMSSLDRLENDLAKADNKLGVVPVTEQLDEAIYLDKLHEFGLQDAANIKAADAAIKKARLPLIKHTGGGITYFMFAKEDLDKAVKAVEQVIDKSKEDEWS